MVLLTGANGQLGQDFQKLFNKLCINYIATGYKEVDITDREAIAYFVTGKNIDIIINCAAYNDVDRAESEPDRAFLLIEMLL